jgi:UDP-GlcNAc:undecaprenyl-phosphate/decaprenyl-phosphate GlcNAc-1-phosphate transferase
LPDELRLILALGSALALAMVATPIAIRVARRTHFLDHPIGYKGHSRATPYLGGAALIAAFLPPALIFGGGLSDFAAIIGCAVALSVVGTVDDRVGLGPLMRVGVEIAAAAVLWVAGIGWFLFDADLINLLLTVVWVVGVVNAFNLMDNEDGAAAAVGLASSLGVSALALVEGAPLVAGMAAALAGACAAFLRFNLARPSRIFLGDGGSMPLGFLIAAMSAAVPGTGPLGTEAILAAAALVAIPILDTTLVTFSRLRRGSPLLQGGRDHITHRLLRWLPSAAAVAFVLGVSQVAMSSLGVVLLQAPSSVMVAAGGAYIALGAAIIFALDWPWARSTPPHPSALAEPARQESGP